MPNGTPLRDRLAELLGGLVVLAVGTGWLLAPPAGFDGELSLFFVDIGQGDATLVLGPEDSAGHRRSLLIDAGDRRPDGGAIVGDLLDELGIDRLDYALLTHYDSDHMGGFVTVLSGGSSASTSLLWERDCQAQPTLPSEAIVDLGPTNKDNASIREWQRCVPEVTVAQGEPGTERVVVGDTDGDGAPENLGYTMNLGGGAQAMVVAGDGWVLGHEERIRWVNTANERSIAVWVSAAEDGFDALITGDLIGQRAGAENAPLEPALGETLAAVGIDIEVLQVGHHGAENASEEGFLAAIAPEVAVISAGDDNSHEHPRCATYQALAESASVTLVAQTEAGETDCPGSLPLQPRVANGTVRIDAHADGYIVRTHGGVSPVDGTAVEPFELTCTLDAGCDETPDCCRTCTTSQACGDGCIPLASMCHQPPGCACQG